MSTRFYDTDLTDGRRAGWATAQTKLCAVLNAIFYTGENDSDEILTQDLSADVID